MSDSSATQNSILIALAKKLLEFRFVAFPHNSFRELILYRYIRPVIIKLLSSRPSNRTDQANVVSLSPKQFDRSDIKQILIIKCDRIGDFVLGLPALSILRKGFPKAEISLLCSPVNESLALQSGLVDKVYCLDYFNLIEQRDSIDKISNHLETLSKISFDLALDLRIEADTRVLLNYVQSKFKAGFEHLYAFFQPDGPQLPALDFAIPVPSIAVEGNVNYARHTQPLLYAFASGLVGMFEIQSERNISIKPLLNKELSILPSYQGKGPKIGINIGSSSPTRNWPIENFVTLTKRLTQELDATIILLGTEDQENEANLITSAAALKNFVNLTGKVPLDELGGIIQQFDLYIGHDTGGTHLSSSLNQNTICLHSGVTPLETYGPVGERTVIIKCVNLSCSPCGLRELSHCKSNHRCMRSIDPLRVFSEIEKMLSTKELEVPQKIEAFAFAG